MSEKYDLEERLLEYAARIIRLVEKLPATRAGNHGAGQLLRSGTSALPNHGEARRWFGRAGNPLPAASGNGRVLLDLPGVVVRREDSLPRGLSVP